MVILKLSNKLLTGIAGGSDALYAAELWRDGV